MDKTPTSLHLSVALSAAQVESIAAAVLALVDAELDERVATRLGQVLVGGPSDDVWSSVTDVAARLGVHPRTVYRALRAGRLQGDRVGSRWRVKPDALADWLAKASAARREPAPRPTPIAAARLEPRRPSAGESQTSFRARARAAGAG